MTKKYSLIFLVSPTIISKMLSITVPANVQEILTNVTPYFQDILQEHFLNEAWRNRAKYDLNDIFVTDGNTNIYLSNLQLMKPIINPSKFQVDLEMFNVYIESNLGQLIVEGNVDESSVNAETPMSKSGKIVFTLEDVSFTSNAGIYIDEDSFVPKNYDINMECARKSIKITWTKDGKEKNFESSDVNVEKSLVKHIWAPIVNVFRTDILYSQLGGAIVEQSVSELLIDEPGEMIAISAERASKSNDFIDSILNVMNQYFETSNQNVLKTPSLNINISKGDNQYGFITSSHGEFPNLNTFIRLANMSFYENDGVQYIHGKIKLPNFKFNYVNCKAKYGSDSSNDGKIRIAAYRNEIYIKLSLRKIEDALKMAVDKVQVVRIMDVDFDMDNLKCLSSEDEQIQSWVIGSMHGLAYPALEKKLEEALIFALQNKVMN